MSVSARVALAPALLLLLLSSPPRCVQGLLLVSVHPSSPLFSLGSRAQLVCSVQGCSGTPTIRWAPPDDRPLMASISANSTHSTVTFDPVQIEHDESLLCIASCAGETRKIISKVRVYSLPSSPLVSGPVSVPVSVQSSLVCEVKDTYPPELLTLVWIRGNRTLLSTTGESGSTVVRSKLDYTPHRPDFRDQDQNLEYICRAWMDLPQLSPDQTIRETRVQVQLMSPPTNVSLLASPEQVLEGRSLTLTCQSDGAPPPTLVLSRNGAELHRENSTHFLSFNLSSAQLQDSAHYQCESTNQYGAARDARDISVRAPPTNVSLLASSEQVLEGRSLTLTCQSDGAPPPTLVLSRNGAELHRENSTHFLSFNLSSAQLQDSAHYQCESTNQYGAARDARDISVRAHPLQVSVLQHVTVADSGSSLVLTCETQGCSQTPVLTWTKTGPDPGLGPGPVLLRTRDRTGSRLVLQDLDLQDSGAYSCEAQCDSVTRSGKTQVQVYAFPSDPLLLSSSGPVVLGHDAVFFCSVSSVYPASRLRLQWLMGNESVQSEGGFPHSETLRNVSSELRLDPSTIQNLLQTQRNQTNEAQSPGQRLSCRVEMLTEEGEVWRTRTTSTHIHIHYPPQTLSLSVIPEQVLEGRSLTLTCQSDGAPPPTLVLSRNGAELHRENSTHFLSFNLSSAQLQDSAHYQCESTNQYGAARDARDISVRAPPRITSVLVLPSSVVFEGQNVTVCCSSVCAPPPSVYLTKLTNGTQRHSPDGTFLLVNVSAQDSGLYQVNVSNELGYEVHVFSISVRERRSRRPVPSPDLSLILLSCLCAAVGLSLAALFLEYIRRARKKGSYKLARSYPESNPESNPEST